jgi:hypothetical protein
MQPTGLVIFMTALETAARYGAKTGLVVLGTALVAALVGTQPASSEGVQNRAGTMPNLTVPQDRLPGGCQLAPKSMPAGGTRIRTLWTLQIPRNPWSGRDRAIVASIRMRMFGAPMTPDGPPPSRREARRFYLQTADDIEEAYVAFYHQQSEAEVVTVYGLRFSGLVSDSMKRPGLDAHLVKLGSSVALVTGSGVQCFDAVEAYVRSLRQ